MIEASSQPSDGPPPSPESSSLAPAAPGGASGAAPSMLRLFLERSDAPCPGCGYNLRGLTGDVCPECAQRLHLTVGLVEPRLAAFVAGVIGLSLGLGFTGIFLAFVAWMLLFTTAVGGFPGHAAAILIVAFVTEAVVLVAWLRQRARLRRLSAPARWGLALGAWALSAACAIVFFATVN